MSSERMAEHIHAATEAQTWLQNHGSYVESTLMHRGRPVLAIFGPPRALLEKARRITVNWNGRTTSVWSATYNGCEIRWR